MLRGGRTSTSEVVNNDLGAQTIINGLGGKKRILSLIDYCEIAKKTKLGDDTANETLWCGLTLSNEQCQPGVHILQM